MFNPIMFHYVRRFACRIYYNDNKYLDLSPQRKTKEPYRNIYYYQRYFVFIETEVDLIKLQVIRLEWIVFSYSCLKNNAKIVAICHCYNQIHQIYRFFVRRQTDAVDVNGTCGKTDGEDIIGGDVSVTCKKVMVKTTLSLIGKAGARDVLSFIGKTTGGDTGVACGKTLLLLIGKTGGEHGSVACERIVSGDVIVIRWKDQGWRRQCHKLEELMSETSVLLIVIYNKENNLNKLITLICPIGNIIFIQHPLCWGHRGRESNYQLNIKNIKMAIINLLLC